MKFRCGLCSLQPHQNFIRYKSFNITFQVLQYTFNGYSHFPFTIIIKYFPLFHIYGNLDS